MSTFVDEQTLPKLPLPDLQRTLKEMEGSLKPLYYADGYYKHPLHPEESSELHRNIDAFLKSEAAAKLQEKLKVFDRFNGCYLDKLHLDINNHSSTKEIQDDVLPRNPFLILAEDADPEISQAERGGVLCSSALRFVSALRQAVLPADASRDGEPMSMLPYTNLFGTTRCPVFEHGEIESFDLNKPYDESDLEAELNNLSAQRRPSTASSESSNHQSTNSDDESEFFNVHGITRKQYPDSKHIIIISKGQYYTLEVLDENENALFTDSQLSRVFQHIIDDSTASYSLKRATALGSLTSYSFKNWKYARKRLQKRYPQELNVIDSALFVMVLDESTDTYNINEDCKRLYYGTSIIDDVTGFQVGSCTSRWYDKLQLVVTADSKAAVIWDSFTCDGSVVLRFTSDIYAESILRLAREVHAGDPHFSLWPQVPKASSKDPWTKKFTKITWSFSHILNTHVHLSETKLTDLISKHDIVHTTIPFGRRTAQKLGVRADSLIQVALQVAHYALYGKMVFSFEPVSTRFFQNSRSTFIPIQTQELLELCQLFISNSLNERGKLEKFISACGDHSDRIHKAQHGAGFEKHFNAIKYLFQFHDHFDIGLSPEEYEISAKVFNDDMLEPFSAPELIASNCGNSAMTAFGVTPAVPQGFGIGYIIKNDQCDITLTSQYRQGSRLAFMLKWVLTEIDNYWELSSAKTVKISPKVDQLYEIDNAINQLKFSSLSTKPEIAKSPIPFSERPNLSAFHQNSSSSIFNGGHGFLELKGHLESRTSSRPISRSGSNLKLSSMNNQNSLQPTLSNGLDEAVTSTISITSEILKQNAGHEILKIDASNIAEKQPPVPKKNVVSSKFEINFDRSSVGRKVNTRG
ncbi:unnamed protein product [Kluyveromyces dobzhanskii CBS 2104]|uniref:WGS project CCBQ000000000 data, contig 00102 n=1 Tax=Kluyveromyces dobzhanskii CBS 2104 TaxID=1427455 RepID=A0A0A8L6F6_9SACH|nr:unnamed protein product [Kluyveromyces dobzhanskii CBS 2104]